MKNTGVVLTPSQISLIRKACEKEKITNRSLIFATNSARKKVLSQKELNKHIKLFNKWVVLLMNKSKYCTSVPTYTDKHPHWSYILKGCQKALLLKEEFNISTEAEAFEFYIQGCIDMMKHAFHVKYLSSKANQLFQSLEVKLAIYNDADSQDTKEFASAYIHLARKAARGFQDKTVLEPGKYYHFIYGRLEAEDQRADYSVWIQAQIDGLKWTGKLPELNQLYGPGARDRYSKHLVELVKEGETKASMQERQRQESLRNLKNLHEK